MPSELTEHNGIPFTIGGAVRVAATRFTDVEALVGPAQRWTFGELDSEVDDISRALLAMGVDAGDRVAIWAPNSVEWVMLALAIARVGGMLCHYACTRAYQAWADVVGLRQGDRSAVVPVELIRLATGTIPNPLQRPLHPKDGPIQATSVSWTTAGTCGSPTARKTCSSSEDSTLTRRRSKLCSDATRESPKSP